MTVGHGGPANAVEPDFVCMLTAEFDFELPGRLIAQRLARSRDRARLLEVGDDLADRRIADLPELLRPGDLLVVNDTRVIAARLVGRRGAVRIEATLNRRLAPDTWSALARPGRRLKVGDRIAFTDDLGARVAEKRAQGEIVLAFERAGGALDAAIAAVGTTPLPPYLDRPDGPDARDRRDYQSIFATRDGAVAAPTASLHFTPALMDAIAARDVGVARVTLHVGAGTFLPVTAEDARDHEMLPEAGAVDDAAAAAINATRDAGGRVVAVGTTTARLIETAARVTGVVDPFCGETSLFILPGYWFRAVDLLFTNFHLPRTTLFMLVCAFGGTENLRRAYAHAIAARYRFYSYGDAMLLARATGRHR